MTVQRIIRGIEVKDDLLGSRLVRREEEVNEQALDRRRIMPDLVVAAGSRGRMLEPVQGALAGERRAIRAPGLELASEDR